MRVFVSEAFPKRIPRILYRRFFEKIMDLSKKGIRKERVQLESTAPRMGKRFGVSLLRVLMYLLIAMATSGICLAAGSYQGMIDDAPDITDASISPLGYASFVYDSSGNQIQKLSSVEGNRVSMDIKNIPENMQHAIVAIEDSRFYDHNGVDPHGMIRAFAVMLSSNFAESEGASTITQQLLKNNVFTEWMYESRIQRIKRKIQEQYLAVQLEKSLKDSGQNPKDVVLENYLNTVNFGSGAYGIQTAAQTYFGKDAKALTLSECAVLAAIPQNPSKFNPKLYPEKNAQRMKTVLDYMLTQGYISPESYKDALNDNVYARIQEKESAVVNDTEVYSYFIDELINQVKHDLMTQKGYTEDQATNAIYNSGLRIYSTEDSSIQKIMEDEFSKAENFPAGTEVNLDWALTVDKKDGTRVNYSREMLQQYYQENLNPDFNLYFGSPDEAQLYINDYKSHVVEPDDTVVAERTDFTPQPQACMTVIDQKNGHVVGIIGGRGKKTGSLTLNRATGAYRQPGSTFKIPSTYGPALDQGVVTLGTPENSKDTTYKDGIEQGTGELDQGTMTIREAIVQSNNVIAIKVIQAITPATGFEYLSKLGFSSLVADPAYDESESLALGGITNGVNDLELTACYAAIANGGTYIRPVFYTKVTDNKGNVILENNTMAKQVFKPGTAWLLTNAMQDVVSKGTGTGFQLDSDIPVAGKTGTGDSDVDLQFVGYTPYYTAGIWAGYDSNKELSEECRGYIHTLWTSVMNRIHAGLDMKSFQKPDNIVQATICNKSGLLSGNGCEAVNEYFEKSTVPSDTCVQHKPTPAPQPSISPEEKDKEKEKEKEKEEENNSQQPDPENDEGLFDYPEDASGE